MIKYLAKRKDKNIFFFAAQNALTDLIHLISDAFEKVFAFGL